MTQDNKANQQVDLPIIALVGTTASGKTSFAVQLAHALGGEIISADSRQVYRRMDIGTGKDLKEYILKDGVSVPYHLIDIEEPGNYFNLYAWLDAFHKAYDEIVDRGRYPILCGGTGLYIESALDGRRLSPVPQNSELRKELENLSHRDLLALLRRYHLPIQVDRSSHRRAVRALEIAQYYAKHGNPIEQDFFLDDTSVNRLPYLLFMLEWPIEERRKRIAIRLEQRINDGMIEEVANLLEEGVPKEVLLSYGLEYRFITLYLLGELTREEAIMKLEIAIRQFAKRQMTWFRGMQRRGFALHNLDALLPQEQLLQEALSTIYNYMHCS